MQKQDRYTLLHAAAQTLAWDLFVAAAYGRRRGRIDLADFDRTLRSAVRQWNATNRNLENPKEKRP